MDVLVIGGSGLVGTNLMAECRGRGHDARGTYYASEDDDLEALDKTDPAAVSDLVEEYEPDAIVDTAAFHAVDECEHDRGRAWRVNAQGTANVAAAAAEVDAHLLYLSTDYVFPGDPETAPYGEDDPVKPCNYYAECKYAAEQAARLADRTTVFRPSVIYGRERQNFVTWALGELESGNEIDIVDDQVSRPTYAPDLARAAIDALEAELTGLYHATGPASSDRYEFTVTLAEAFGFDEELVAPISTAELGQEAPRPADSSLDSSRLYDELGWSFDPPRVAFERMASET